MFVMNRQSVVFPDPVSDQIQNHGSSFAGLVCQYTQRLKTPCNGSGMILRKHAGFKKCLIRAVIMKFAWRHFEATLMGLM
jgi:hypothetical protein